MIDDDMLPPVHSDSDYSDNESDSDMLTGMGNPNRPPPQVRETHSSDDDSDNDNNDWAAQSYTICQVSSSLYQRAVWGEEGR
mgnify:CR=1 FL=1